MRKGICLAAAAAVVIGASATFLLWPKTDAGRDTLAMVAPSAISPLSSVSGSSGSAAVATATTSPSAAALPQPATGSAAPAPDGTLAPRFEAGNPAQQRAASRDSELLAVRGMLRDYRASFGQNPVGTNREITRALLGNNPRGVRFNFSADPAGNSSGEPRLDERGRLLDRWGHPYFFHQLSGSALEVRSAGPDGVMWNADDEATR